MMAPVHIYGIKNCSTMKKAFQWLERRNISYVFHDYKKSGADAEILRQAISEKGWENIINRKGMSWRALSYHARKTMGNSTALAAALENPSLIRRPMLVRDGKIIFLGFDEAAYAAIFSK